MNILIVRSLHVGVNGELGEEEKKEITRRSREWLEKYLPQNTRISIFSSSTPGCLSPANFLKEVFPKDLVDTNRILEIDKYPDAYQTISASPCGLAILFLSYPHCDRLSDYIARSLRVEPYFQKQLKKGEALIFEPASPHPRLV